MKNSVVSFLPEEWRKLSHRERRKQVNKARRKCKRTAVAIEREKNQKMLESRPEYQEHLWDEERQREEQDRQNEAMRLLQNAVWLEREKMAQEEFRKKKELEEKRRKEKEEREQLIREEWETLQKKEKETVEARDRERKEKEEKRKEALQLGETTRSISAVASEPWHNPILPANFGGTDDPLPIPKAVEERGSQQCSFYMKTGACRYGDRCSRTHPRPSISTTLLIPNMYSSLALRERLLNERGQEGAIEHDDREAYEDFRKFFYDVLDEFSKAGQVVQFKVSCNEEVHLRGNVYVQYSSEEECGRAYHMFNGRWYAQKQLSCQFCPVTRWRAAICGLANQNRCPKGRNCNFLHVYRNPGGAFARADRDLPPLTSSPTQKISRRQSGRGRSPVQRFHSPHRQSHSRSHRRSHSRSPHRQSHSRSPHRRSHSRSPRHRSRSHSPRRRSHSPCHRRSYWHDRSTSRDRYRGRLRHRYHRSRSKDRRGRRTSREKWPRDHRRSQRSRSGSANMSPASESDDSSLKHKNKNKKKKKKSKKKDHKHKHRHSSSHSQNGDKSREASEVRVMEGETSVVEGEANTTDFADGVNEEMEADCKQLVGCEDMSYTDTKDGSMSGGHQARECLVAGDGGDMVSQLSTGSAGNERLAPEMSQDNKSTSEEVVKKN